MNKDKNEYFDKTMLESLIASMLSSFKRFIGWLALDVMIITIISISIIAVGVMIMVSSPSDREQKQTALDTYYECRHVQELSEEACLLLALEID